MTAQEGLNRNYGLGMDHRLGKELKGKMANVGRYLNRPKAMIHIVKRSVSAE